MVRPGLDVLRSFSGGVDAQLGTLIEIEVVKGEAAGNVVDDRLGNSNVRIIGHAGWLELEVREFLHEALKRNAVLQADGHGDGEGIHDSCQGRSLLAQLEEYLTETTVVIGSCCEVTTGTSDLEARGATRTGLGKPLTARTVLDTHLWLGSGVLLILLVGERLAHLAVVAVDGQCLEAEFPALHVDIGNVLDG